MNPNTIAALVVIGYIIITAIIVGVGDRKQNDAIVALSPIWPLFLVAIVVFAIGYFPYKLAKGFTARKEE